MRSPSLLLIEDSFSALTFVILVFMIKMDIQIDSIIVSII